jgi:hypothetical protein
MFIFTLDMILSPIILAIAMTFAIIHKRLMQISKVMSLLLLEDCTVILLKLSQKLFFKNFRVKLLMYS